jgi:hypothetical protein
MVVDLPGLQAGQFGQVRTGQTTARRGDDAQQVLFGRSAVQQVFELLLRARAHGLGVRRAAQRAGDRGVT